ncbi:DUF5803 family protein [Halovivax cerinus]|uniref:DUF5803 family protein n=1 Tax=Halovivax cerinus TaxID=1487865 RepID=A0ABD5NK80_9EURY|nr:DUF5803 family protein [Halovivax cerinus]
MISAPHRRLVLALLVVAVLVVTAGCAAMSNDIPDEQLDEDAEYDDLRERDATVAIDLEAGGMLSDGSFRAVYTVNGTDELELYRTGLYSDSPVSVHGVRFWYPNDTVVTGSELDVERGDSRTRIGLPADNGTLAVSGPAGKKTFALPAVREGSYNVTLPEGHRSSSFVLGSVEPGAYDRRVLGETESLYWESVDSSISVRYYHERDRTLFYGLVVLVLGAGGVAAAVTYRRIKRLERRRMAMSVESDDGTE